jgi:two-component system LytT family response regulator
MTASIRTLIVDDEPIARKRLRRLLGSEPDIELLADCGNGRDALRVLESDSPDVVFLDVQMPELSAFEVLRQLPVERRPLVVFVTAYDQYALHAFEEHALDYLLKPFSQERLQLTFGRVRDQLRLQREGGTDSRLAALLEALDRREREATAQNEHGYLTRIMVKTSGRVVFLKASEIDWIESLGNYVRLHVRDLAHMVRGTMITFEKRLDPRMFARIHRSAIVNLDRVKEMQSWSSGESILLLTTGFKLRISRVYRDKLEERLR